MASPPEVTIKDLSGHWVMNKTLSDNVDPVLVLQGIGWWTRKALSLATVYLHCTQYTSEDGHTHIDIDQTATGGIKGTSENRELDWTFRTHTDHVFGTLKGKTRWLKSLEDEESADPFLREGWLDGDEEKGGPEGEIWVQSFAENEEKGWTGNQVWGFAIVDGKRYYTRRVVITKGSEVAKVRLIYDWSGGN